MLRRELTVCAAVGAAEGFQGAHLSICLVLVCSVGWPVVLGTRT